MPAEDQGPYEPLPEFISETADEVIGLAPAAGIFGIEKQRGQDVSLQP